MNIKNVIVCIASFFLSLSGGAQPMFTRILPDESGLKFFNALAETPQFNSFVYEYIYNGGGVAVGDINNDGLQDLYFSGNVVANKLFLNTGDLTFKDITETAGVSGADGFNTGVSMVDINNDGLLDIYVCRSASTDARYRKNILYINNGDFTFTDKAQSYGLDDASYSTQAYFNDLDVDGDLDLFLVNHPFNISQANNIYLTYDKKGKLVAKADTHRTHVSCRYYENSNNKFVDRTIKAGLGTHAFGLSAIIDDFNKDGYPDIYTCNDYHEPDYLFINNKNGTFTNRFEDYFKHTCYSSMGSDYADINNDGFPDLMVLDMLPQSLIRQKQLRGPGNYDNFNKRVEYGFGYQYVKNVLQLNNGNGSYSDISYLAGVAFTDWSWAPMIADFDNDGNKDIYVTNGYYRDITDLDFSFFKFDSIRKAVINSKSQEDAMLLMANIPSVKVSNYLFKNNGNLTFENFTSQAGVDVGSWSNGGVYADLDNDGDLDLVVNNLNEESFLFRNNSTENKSGNYIRFKLKGTPQNVDGIGAIVEIETADSKKQLQHFNPIKGFLSSHERIVHFGIGKNLSANVKITWPNGSVQLLNGLNANAIHTVAFAQTSSVSTPAAKIETAFVDITKQTKVNYKHKENTYIDFKVEPLLPHQFSMIGPCIAVADVNADGYDDFFVGGSKDNEGKLYMQDSSGKFVSTLQSAITADKKYEDTGAEFFDADMDGDMDLLVVSGGNESPGKDAMYLPRLYLNDGKGKFVKNDLFPVISSSGKAIAISDYDKDGDSDIFIGGRVVPGHYGRIPKSYMLQNHNGQFTDITAQIPDLSLAGMVTDAIWSDVNGDGWNDLVLVGEWMPLTIYINKEGKINATPIVSGNSHGWWNTIAQADLDNDGDVDLIGGNVGLNTRYRGNETWPVTMVASDFDNNGSTDCIISLYEDSVSYPIVLRDNLLDHMNYLKKKYLRYSDYASATIEDIFTKEQLNNAQKFKADNMASSVFINDGKGNFTVQLLSVKTQIAPVNAILTDDFDVDGKTDLLLAGNDYATEVETGRNDAGIGLMLRNNGENKFRAIPLEVSGFFVPGDVKCMKWIKIKNKRCVIVGKNQEYIQILEKI